MRRTIVILTIALSVAGTALAMDSSTATKFLRDYIKALQLTKSGDGLVAKGNCGEARQQYGAARKLMASYAADSETNMRGAAKLVTSALDQRESCSSTPPTMPLDGGPLTHSAIEASWALYWPIEPEQSWVDSRGRKKALSAIEQAFGPVSAGPQKGQSDIDAAAATLAYYLAHPQQDVQHPRGQAARPQNSPMPPR